MSVVPLDSVMYDPLAWIHPARFALPTSLDGIAQRSILNGMLISLYGLSLERPALPAHSLPRQFVEAWHLLPQTALLMACQRHRASLAKGGYGAGLPDWLGQFTALPLVASRSSPAENVPHPAQLLAWGKYELLAFADGLPRSLRQRLDLLFPPEEGRKRAGIMLQDYPDRPLVDYYLNLPFNMPRDIPLRRMPPVYGGILIKREHLQRQRCAMDLVKQARREAVKCLKQAAEEAEQLRSQARNEGYQQGVLAAADTVAGFFAERQQLSLSLQREIEEHARALLMAALSHTDLLLLLEEWLAQQPAPSMPEPLELWVPADRRAAALRLKRQIGALWGGKYDIITHEGGSFIMKYGDQVAEFDAGAFIDAATRQLVSRPDYDSQAQRLSGQGLQALADRLTRHFAGEPVTPLAEP